MNLGEKKQIMLTSEAYGNLIDMIPETSFEDNFKKFQNVEVKHGVRLDVYQYCSGDDFVNPQPPEVLDFLLRFEKVIRQLIPGIPAQGLSSEEGRQVATGYLKLMEGFAGLLSGAQLSPLVNEAKLIEGKVDKSKAV